MKLFIQAGIALGVLVFSTIASWYEGSTLTQDIWEWKHTAVFSNWFNGSVNQTNDILTIDYFIYAAKFVPAYPLAMLLSGTYLIILIGYILFRRKTKLFSYFLTGIGIVFLVLCSLVSGSPTIGLTMFFYSTLLIGILAIGVAIILLATNKNKGITT
ncbi:YjdJ family protein [Psychrobacillus sp. FSL W7-1457]|uniref:YjdJ family protein n=1 Tax=unclassified Psychrobacillus TaxID=2636677 RepID=UPI0030F5C028